MAQRAFTLEDYEFATSNAAAAAGVIDLTDPPNRPSFYINGVGDRASPHEPYGLYSIGTDAVYCLDFTVPCLPGSFIGFRRDVDPIRFPLQCAGGTSYAPLDFTYGDPGNPGPVPADFPLSALDVRWDVYGDGPFGDGLTGCHLWLRLIDCEGEAFEFVNYSEVSLYSHIWTLDVRQGQGMVRLSPASVISVPGGDRLLTEIVAAEVLIQDTDDPPTTFGKWYVDYLRIIEPGATRPGDWNGDGYVDLVDMTGFAGCVAGPGVAAPAECDMLDGDGDADVDLTDFQWFQFFFNVGL